MTPDLSALGAVVFDMDGVLVDSEPIQEESLAEFLRRRGCALPQDEYAATIGLNHQAFWELMIERFGLEGSIDDFVAEAQELLLPRLAGIPAKPGARELVRGLAGDGIPVALASSSHRPVVDAIVGAIGLADVFNVIVTGEEVNRGKPAPDIYLLAAGRLGIAPSRCVAVEDSPHGIQAANEAGMTCLGIVTAYSSADQLPAALVVDSLEEVSPADLEALIARPRP